MGREIPPQQYEITMDAYELITNKIVEAMENGVNPWKMPWRINTAKSGGIDMPYWSRKGKGYSFLNCMLLSMQGKKGGEFITLKQANAEGGRVKKGAQSAVVVFWCLGYDRKGTDDQGNEITERVKYRCPVLKSYRVFSVDDCEGLKERASAEPAEAPEAPDPIEEGERLLNDYLKSDGAPAFSTGSDNAFYSPSADAIKVPALEQYENAAEYYSTAFHECVHSTGHASRLDRDITKSFRGSEEYAAEELVAEIGSAYLCAAAGIDDEAAFNNSAAYLRGWAKRIKDDKKLFPVAAARAERAARYILGQRDF